MNLVNYLKRPEYIWHPRQVLRRFLRIGKKPSPTEEIELPWGATVRVQTEENVGVDIYYYGVFDPIVPETIWRLLDRGETAIDVGANIGQNTSVMAFRAGTTGHVIAFEPHPVTFEQLRHNVESWPKKNYATVQLENTALSAGNGETTLQVTGYLSGASLDGARTGIRVPLRRLDSFIAQQKAVGVCKIDVEGHELSVMQGAEESFARKLVRDVIFEDFNPMPSPVVRVLQKNGFEVFQLIAGRLKPALKPLSEKLSEGKGFSYNYLATLSASRAVARFRALGWRCLMGF